MKKIEAISRQRGGGGRVGSGGDKGGGEREMTVVETREGEGAWDSRVGGESGKVKGTQVVKMTNR